MATREPGFHPKAGVATFGVLLTVCFYKDRPPHIFPSRVAEIRARAKRKKEQDLSRIAEVAGDGVEGLDAGLVEGSSLGVQEVVALWMKLLEDKEFLKLVLGFGTGLAIFNSLMTVIQQIISPAGYSSDDAGSFGGILIGSGLVGAMIVGPLLDYTKAYKTVLKIGMPIGLVAVTAFVANLKPDNFTVVAICIGCLGFVMLPMLPVSLETAAECTYPIPEDCSSALLMTTGQLVGIPLIFGLDWLISMRSKYDGNVWTPAAIFLVIAISICVIFVWWFDGKMKRLAVEQMRSFSGSRGRESGRESGRISLSHERLLDTENYPELEQGAPPTQQIRAAEALKRDHNPLGDVVASSGSDGQRFGQSASIDSGYQTCSSTPQHKLNSGKKRTIM